MDEKLTIYERIYSWENLLNAYHEAGREKWFKQDVANFTAHLEENLISIQNELIWRTYSVGRYREFYVYEPKKRLIMALSFRDRVVQWAIYLQLNPLFDNQFIFHSEEFLNEQLHLELNAKTTINKVRNGISFVGLQIHAGWRKMNRKPLKKMKARIRFIEKQYAEGLIDLEAVQNTMASYYGMMSHCNSYGLRRWIERNITFQRKDTET